MGRSLGSELLYMDQSHKTLLNPGAEPHVYSETKPRSDKPYYYTYGEGIGYCCIFVACPCPGKAHPKARGSPKGWISSQRLH